MTKKIIQYLERIEAERNIKILLACETGSRAWGFPSPDSDFDIRIIYVHTKDWYLSLNEKKDSIELMFENNDIDITGWDLRKSLRLLQKSNPPLLERIQSPIIYKCDKTFVADINKIAYSQYSRIATIHHYLSMAKKFLEELKQHDEFKLKKFFYALRSATACKWILEKEELPPIVFQEMIQGLEIDQQLIDRINELINLKATISESYMHSGEIELINFIETCINQANDKRNTLPSSHGTLEELDTFFLTTLS
ncbi:nucleotidyltransferase domain-containing protein [uncultured Nonlabens sp.]|uniref:nucleotidyltransferase domain-containing protein n=1 Tax=uncultured Nonlabens sp. TaxID=859306 RepID=UPI0026193099|nr:nucleotidyltransferase domain-containing protein [uncultured Nonlabens sp.]